MKKTDLKSLDLGALWRGLTRPDATGADRVVPPTGYTAQLTLFSAGAMAFLAVFALALALATGRLAERWSTELAQTVTVRLSAPADQIDDQTATVLEVLKTTPGVAEARLLPDAEVEKLLEPWFGPDVPVEALPVPRLIEVSEGPEGFDSAALALRLQGEAPGAVLDDHTRWREPLVRAAGRLRALGLFSLLLIAATSGAMITLAAKASLAANGQVIRVLRLIGARDITIATAFVRRFTRRAALGAAPGSASLLINRRNPTLSTLSAEWAAEVAASPRFPGERWEERVTVEVTTLDALIELHGVPRFCKIDVEGFERAVLDGLSRPVECLSFEFIPETPDRAHACLERLADLGTHRYNVALGEERRLLFADWVDQAGIARWLESRRPADGSGDIYARYVPFRSS